MGLVADSGVGGYLPVHVGPFVLLVDPDDLSRQALICALREAAYEVHGVASGDEGLELLKQGARPRAIVVDLIMPGMDGLEFCCECDRHPETAVIPRIVAVPQGDAAHYEDRLADCGAVAVLVRPFGLDELLAVLQVYWERKN